MRLISRSVLLAAAAALAACAGNSPPIHTSAGDTPASIVVSQDVAGDVLNTLEAAQNAAVARHDATPVCSALVTTACDASDAHAARSRRLHVTAAGLRAGWDGLTTWKRVGGATPPAGVFCELARDAPILLGDAAALGVQAQKADLVLKFAASILAAGCAS